VVHPVPFDMPSVKVLHVKHGTLERAGDGIIAVCRTKPGRRVIIPMSNVAALEYAVE